MPAVIPVNVDNNQAKVFSENSCVNSKLRTAFSLKNNWVKELRDDGIVKVNQIPADINISDFLTKPLPGYKVKKYCKMINPYIINPKDITNVQQAEQGGEAEEHSRVAKAAKKQRNKIL